MVLESVHCVLCGGPARHPFDKTKKNINPSPQYTYLSKVRVITPNYPTGITPVGELIDDRVELPIGVHFIVKPRSWSNNASSIGLMVHECCYKLFIKYTN